MWNCLTDRSMECQNINQQIQFINTFYFVIPNSPFAHVLLQLCQLPVINNNFKIEENTNKCTVLQYKVFTV